MLFSIKFTCGHLSHACAIRTWDRREIVNNTWSGDENRRLDNGFLMKLEYINFILIRVYLDDYTKSALCTSTCLYNACPVSFTEQSTPYGLPYNQ